jgi:hypothetical protein
MLKLELSGSGSVLLTQGTITVSLTPKKRGNHDTIASLSGMAVRPTFFEL